MNKIVPTFCNQIKKIFNSTQDQNLIDAINLRNIRNAFTFSAIVCVFDVFTLILFSITNWHDLNFHKTFFNVVFCIIACALVAVLSEKLLRKYEKEGVISNVKSTLLITFFYVTLSAWAIMVDAVHYQNGDQMMTFFIVQFCFVCFVVMQPKIGAALITLSYFSLYLSLYFIDGAARIQLQNYAIFALMAVFGNAIQHMMLQESEKYKSNILALNNNLKREASVDDLTNLKNRTALRNDFEKHIGENVYTIMADVDKFKSYNDIYGHLVGDEVLRQVASVAKEAFRDGDVYRYGGDEFLIILAGCTDEEFETRVKKWKKAMQTIHIPNVTQSVATSYGYEHCLLKSPGDLRNAIKTADERLYIAKKARYSAVSN